MDAWDVSEWASVAEATATVVTAFVAIIAAVFAFVQVREARRLREDQAKPYVVVDIQSSPSSMQTLNLVIENIGTTMARNVRIDFSPPIATSVENYDLANAVLLREGLPMIPPGRRMEFLFDRTVNRREAGLPMRYDVTVTYADKDLKEQEPLQFPIDLEPLYGMRFVRQNGLHQAVTAIEQIAGSLDRWSASGRLRVEMTQAREERLFNDSEFALTGLYPSLGHSEPPEILMWLMRFTPLRVLVRVIGTRLRRSTP